MSIKGEKENTGKRTSVVLFQEVDKEENKEYEEFFNDTPDQKGEQEHSEKQPSAVSFEEFNNDSVSSSIRFRRKSLSRAIRSFKIGNLEVEDHFSVPKTSSIHRYLGKNTITFPHSLQGAIVLEHDIVNVRKPLTVKYYNDGTCGFYIIRAFYTLVASLVATLVFLFSIQVILFHWIGLVVDSGLSSVEDLTFRKIMLSLGSICSIPCFLLGTAEVMTNATNFVFDAWEGHLFLATFLSNKHSLIISWISMIVYILVPLTWLSCSLLVGSTIWWDSTLYVWFILVFLYFGIYHFGLMFYEIKGCLEIVHFHPITFEDKRFNSKEIFSIPNALQCLYLSKKWQLSGLEHVRYLSVDGHPSAVEEIYADSKDQENFSSSISIYSRLTLFLCKVGLFEECLERERMFTVNEATELSAVVNEATWSLEKIYCRDRSISQLDIVGGKAALRPGQIESSLVCFFMGFFLKLLVVIGLLVWMKINTVIIIVICILILAFSMRVLRGGVIVGHIINSVRKDPSIEARHDSTYLYQACIKYRVSIPNLNCCYIVTAVEYLVFFLFPVICLFVSDNIPVASVLLFFEISVTFNRIFDMSRLFKELGSLEGLDKSCVDANDEWNKKHKYSLMGTKRSTFWLSVFSVIMTLLGCVFLGAAFSGKTDGVEKLRTVPNFIYHGTGDLKYPACTLGHISTLPSGSNTSLVDFSFLATTAYRSREARTDSLRDWFMNESYIERNDVVDNFRYEYETMNRKSAVEYTLTGFPGQDLGIVSIRGTTSLLDTLVDIQLWAGSCVSKAFRFILPGGELLTPIFRQMIRFIAYIEDGTLRQISFYQETTAFMLYLKEKNIYSNLVLTGHSLGGGLAMITAAQSQTPSIVFSSPNALLSRDSFGPTPVTESGLDEYTFNVVPDRDVVPLMDDLSKKIEKISCRQPSNKFHLCHISVTTLCELLYTCGSFGRPIPCRCVTEYGYDAPDPLDTNGKMFSEMCST